MEKERAQGYTIAEMVFTTIITISTCMDTMKMMEDRFISAAFITREELVAEKLVSLLDLVIMYNGGIQRTIGVLQIGLTLKSCN